MARSNRSRESWKRAGGRRHRVTRVVLARPPAVCLTLDSGGIADIPQPLGGARSRHTSLAFRSHVRGRLALGLVRAEDEIVDGLALRKSLRQSFRVERLANRIGREGGPAHELVCILRF